MRYEYSAVEINARSLNCHKFRAEDNEIFLITENRFQITVH